MTKLTLDDLSARFDPEYIIQEPSIVYSRELSNTATYIITSAQNATPVDADFWAVLQHIAHVKGAEILVAPIRYKNPTSQWSGSQQNADYYDKLVRPYLWNQRLGLNSNLSFLGDIRVVPTASNPLAGLEAIADASSSILAHPRLQMRSVATPHSKTAKVLWTTGVCTVPNYTDSRVGRLGRSHHSLSALIVEMTGGKFFIRRLHWDAAAKSVIDLCIEYKAGTTGKAPRPLAVILGDTHVGFVDPGVQKATFGDKGLVPTLRPRHLIYHDLLDAYSVNPHHKGNPFNAVAKFDSGWDSAADEVANAIEYVRTNTPIGCVPVIVSSNHDDMLARWIKSNDWREDPVNAEFYLKTALAMVQSTKMTPNGTEYITPLGYWFSQSDIAKLKVLGGGESFFLGDHELGFHGDKGPNGTRGSLHNLRRLGSKVIIGHSHSPGEDEGALQTGTSSLLQLEYNRSAPSSWLNAHAVLHANGFTQLIIIIEGTYKQ